MITNPFRDQAYQFLRDSLKAIAENTLERSTRKFALAQLQMIARIETYAEQFERELGADMRKKLKILMGNSE